MSKLFLQSKKAVNSSSLLCLVQLFKLKLSPNSIKQESYWMDKRGKEVIDKERMKAMGYYNQTPNGRQKPSRLGAFAAGLAGVAAGALLVWLLFYSMPELRPDTGNETQIVQQESEGQSESVSVEITTDVTEAVEIAADAVVGVTNLQEAGGFLVAITSTRAGSRYGFRRHL